MKLFREKKIGYSWSSLEVSGLWDHTISISNPDINKWEDVNEIEYLDLIGFYLVTAQQVNDYQNIRSCIEQAVIDVGWENLTSNQKYIAIKYYCYISGDIDKITFLMSEGMSEVDAINYLTKAWHVHHGIFIKACKERFYYVKIEIMKRMTSSSVGSYCNNIRFLIIDYIELGRLGNDYSNKDTDNCIMNYMQSTGAYINNGFIEAGYSFNSGYEGQDVIDIFVDIIINGLYIKNNSEFYINWTERNELLR